MRRLPSLFVSHGSPMMALEPSPARDFLAGLGTRFPRPRAILVVSAHHDAAYQGGRATVTASPAPPTIHDFGGFPDELFAMRYPAPGDPGLAERIVGLLGAHGLAVTADPERGLDHGAWVPLSLIYPDADLPVVQLSIASNASPEWHHSLGQALAPLCNEGVLIIGSGSITHNLRALFSSRLPIDAPAPGMGHRLHRLDRRPDEGGRGRRRPARGRACTTRQGQSSDPGPYIAAVRRHWRRHGSPFTAERLHASTTYGLLGMDVYSFG
ncbi:dioxygenase [Sphingopyxis sp. PET50]|uniref:dioxygenase family protein n=1 Tax=Sphingopyxis sp. PET50 TaxID=2976533 RepID=UPI0021AF6975|nr:class III extradiol ring-cleavage dioxygenase [Sphingopyxis sp. PET50]